MNLIKRRYLYCCLAIGIIITIFCYHIIKRNDKINVVCFGDSITKGFVFCSWPGFLQRNLDHWQKSKYKVIKKGFNGMTSREACSLFSKEVKPYLPGIVILEFGINDANYRIDSKNPRLNLKDYTQNLQWMYKQIKAQGSICVFIINHRLYPSKHYSQGNDKSYFQNLKPYNDVIRELASEQNVPVIDLEVLFNDKELCEKCLESDGVHLSKYGKTVYADIVFEALKPILKDAV